MALHRQDLSAVVRDLPKTHDTIRRGFSIIRRIVTIGGLKARQSERFLQRLARATMRRNQKVRMKIHQPVPSEVGERHSPLTSITTTKTSKDPIGPFRGQ